MIRLFFVLLFGAAVLAVATHVSIWVFLIPAAVLAAAYLATGNKLRCSACRKRVKIGATSCHHCGRSTLTGVKP